MDTVDKQDLKIKLASHSEFQKAWNAFMTLGYVCDEDLVPYTAPYLYTHADEGRISADYFDSEGVDQSDPNSALGYFNASKHKEVTLEELLAMESTFKQDLVKADIELLKHERPLFEANFVKLGGNLDMIKWSECDDGTGTYEPDWLNIPDNDDPEFGDHIMEHASHVQSCLMAWVECAKSKAIPKGYYLMPLQPSQEMIESAKKELQETVDDDLEDRIVFVHQAMVKTHLQSMV